MRDANAKGNENRGDRTRVTSTVPYHVHDLDTGKSAHRVFGWFWTNANANQWTSVSAHH